MLISRAQVLFLVTSALGCACGGGDSPGAGGAASSTTGVGTTASVVASTAVSTSEASTSQTTTASSTTGTGGGGPITAASCFGDLFVNHPTGGPDYDQYHPVIGSHCMGTNQQDITGVERVVFLGDSITVGTPPTLSNDFYRSQLADALVQKFGLAAPNDLWKLENLVNGTSLLQESGDFASCSKYGARVDDLLVDNTQIEDCIPVDKRDKRTLVVMTMGGNDIAALTKDDIAGMSAADLWLETQAFVQKQRDALAWLYEPGRFPNGVFVVFSNMYEFTDGTGDVQSCDVSALAGFDKPVPTPADLKAMVVWANEQYLKNAVDYGADMIFMLEDFCGHGFHAGDPMAPCYRGPNQETWFDLTCIHPNPTGHSHVTDMFMAVVNE